MKPYIFNNNEYTDLNSLAIAYKENFELGVEDIYSNTKKLIKFVKANTKNKERVKAVIDDIALSKFKNNALTFVIYEFLDIKEVVLNGKAITFEQFIALIKENPDKNNALFTVIIGDNEIKNGTVNIKNNEDKTQETIEIAKVFEYIYDFLVYNYVYSFFKLLKQRSLIKLVI